MAEGNELYKGEAIIRAITAEELSEKLKAMCPASDHGTAFMLVYEVETMETPPRQFDVKLEISHRELDARIARWLTREDGRTPTQIDHTIRDLEKQRLIHRGAAEADLAVAMDEANIGKTVTICVTEKPKGDGTYWPPKAWFMSPFARLKGSAAADRMRSFLTGKTPPPASRPATQPMPPAPAEDDDDLPF